MAELGLVGTAVNVCDSLFEEYVYWSGYPEYNCLRTRPEIIYWELQLCMYPRKQSGKHNPKVNPQEDLLGKERKKLCSYIFQTASKA